MQELADSVSRVNCERAKFFRSVPENADHKVLVFSVIQTVLPSAELNTIVNIRSLRPKQPAVSTATASESTTQILTPAADDRLVSLVVTLTTACEYCCEYCCGY